MLQEFFAVTETSVYHAVAMGENGYPSATKIALKGESEIPIGEELKHGTMIAVCDRLIAYIPEGGGYYGSIQPKIEMVNTRYWGGHSSPIVALFMAKEEALECLRVDGLQPSDSRWKAQKTLQVVQAIDEDNSAFYVCRYPGLCMDIPARAEKS